MNEALEKIKNAQGLREIEQIKLRYSLETLKMIEKYPEILDSLVEDLDTTKDNFFKVLSGEENGNISFYDQSLVSANEFILKYKNRK